VTVRPAGQVVTGVSVTVNIDMPTFSSDLEIYLVGPTGIKVPLAINEPGGPSTLAVVPLHRYHFSDSG